MHQADSAGLIELLRIHPAARDMILTLSPPDESEFNAFQVFRAQLCFQARAVV
jgi:hypothetical protein